MNFGRTRMAVGIVGSLCFCTSLMMSSAFAKPPAPKTTKPTAAQIAAGKKLYMAQMCAGCHAVNGEGGTSGPDLSKEGSDPKHTLDWLKVQIATPKKHNPDSTMPAYGDKIKGKDLVNVAAYVGSLKGAAK